jgi:hypothetical protein
MIRTFPVNPEQRAARLPSTALFAFDEPPRGSRVLATTHDMVIRGWIRWRLPFPKAFPYLVPCSLVRSWIVSDDELITNASRRLLRLPLVGGLLSLPRRFPCSLEMRINYAGDSKKDVAHRQLYLAAYRQLLRRCRLRASRSLLRRSFVEGLPSHPLRLPCRLDDHSQR